MSINLFKNIESVKQTLLSTPSFQINGRLVRIVGLTMEAVGCHAAIGSKCAIINPDGYQIEAEVVGFCHGKIYLMSTDSTNGIMPGAKVIPLEKKTMVAVGEQLLGRVIDGQGEPIDNCAVISTEQNYPLFGHKINPLARDCITEPLDVGVRSINALLTIGRGQRIGLFAGSGVGKSVLLGMMTRFTQADVIVVGLIGERGREVKEFIEYNLKADGLARSVVIAAPADASPLMRLHGAMRATSIAEYFRDQGAHVLLLLDSLTRYAQAQRELGLAIGEPPATKGYPPSVYSKLSQLVERAGNGNQQQGSITGIYTVLTEGDDPNDPIADAARSFLDGHIVLSRDLAESGHYPAIDIEKSMSRVMQMIVPCQQLQLSKKFKQLFAKYMENRDLINVGAYVSGQDPELDQAIDRLPKLFSFLNQEMWLNIDYNKSCAELSSLFD